MKNGKLKIEHGIPVPEKKSGHYPHVGGVLKKMKKGDSVFMQIKPNTAWQNARNHLGKGNFVVRPEKNGARVWRTK